MLGLAKRTKARFLLASTSEVYGDPEVSPQKETYNGNVNQTGPRACYDEGKRVAETLVYGYLYQDNVDVRVARIFNSYGPRMNPYDGRIMSNILMQALKGDPLTIYGDGSQTRSFCYIDDLIDGLIALMNADSREVEGQESVHLPVNLGSDAEITIQELVDIIITVLEEISETRQVSLAKHKIEFAALPVDDPRQRRPDITRAKQLLDWAPKWKLRDGIKEMALSYLDRMETGDL
jgi:UDP-glucuronate decarboxylase